MYIFNVHNIMIILNKFLLKGNVIYTSNYFIFIYLPGLMGLTKIMYFYNIQIDDDIILFIIQI